MVNQNCGFTDFFLPRKKSEYAGFRMQNMQNVQNMLLAVKFSTEIFFVPFGQTYLFFLAILCPAAVFQAAGSEGRNSGHPGGAHQGAAGTRTDTERTHQRTQTQVWNTFPPSVHVYSLILGF